ncbi:hypothetical protein DMC30DRAFT_269355 [Rhodotorula diobovata]|uniref:Uncharacterized protein n=1 Tax=Rhodotorula diobovata TaxID=5288 RepID=A0A5C5FV99_9BASI|nr:hypothetical protein DMC30DRAFT_269355 [Rhodotorula diobovata]
MHWSEVSSRPSTVIDTSDKWRERASSGAVAEYVVVAGKAVARAIPPLRPPDVKAEEASVRAHIVSLAGALHRAGSSGPTDEVVKATKELAVQHLRLCAARKTCALSNIRGRVRPGSWSPPGSTLMGVPRRWPWLSTPEGLAKMQAFTAGVPDDELVLAAFDPGEHRPFTAAVSMPTSDGGRNEALCHVKRGGMLGLSRRAQQHSAAFNNVFYGDLVLDSTDPALRTDGQHGPVLLDTTDQLVKSTLSALYRMNSRRQQLESEAKLRLEAEYSSIADEVRWTLTGGEQFRGGGKKPPGGLKLVVSVGKGIFARSGQQRGASTTAGLLRKLEERLNMVTTDDGKTLEYVIVIAPEDFTSQCCSQPDCVDAEGRRNRMMPAVRTIGR